MSKGGGKKAREDRARRRLARAQLDLHAAQEKRAQAITRAESEVEQAKQRGNKWIAKATERVERRAGALARAEARLLSVSAPRHPARRAATETAGRSSDRGQAERTAAEGELTVSTPIAAAEVLERDEQEAAQRDPGSLVLPEHAPGEPPSPSNGAPFPGDGLRPDW